MKCPKCGQVIQPSRAALITKLVDPNQRGIFFRFHLDNGGRVHIPPDQVARMWNEEQVRKTRVARRKEAIMEVGHASTEELAARRKK